MAKTNAERQADYRRNRELERRSLINSAYCLGRLDMIDELSYRCMDSIVEGIAAMQISNDGDCSNNFIKATHRPMS